MKCQICEEYFYKETEFANMFEFSSICDKCSILYNPQLYLETIPINQGKIEYIYLYEDLSMNAKQKAFLIKHVGILIKEMYNSKHKKAIYLILDDYLVKDIKGWLPFLLPFKNLCFMSLIRYDFDAFMNFH